jgi:predicted dehydrogenase
MTGGAGLRAVVIGAGWGVTHIRALRELGVDVVALVGAAGDSARTEAVAREHGIDLVLDDTTGALELSPDLVTLATPAHTHVALLRRLASVPVICEKPVLGVGGDASRLPERGAPVYVNYAFSFLDTARALAQELRDLGPARAVTVDTAHDLPLAFTPAEWFLEVASHPLSFVVHLLGPPELRPGPQECGPAGEVRLRLRCGVVPVDAVCRPEPGLRGLRHRVSVQTDAGVLSLEGRYVQGQLWRYGPLRLDGRELTRSESPPEDCWYRANRRSIGTVLRALAGDLDEEQAATAGLFTPARAMAVDRCVQRAALAPVGDPQQEVPWPTSSSSLTT